MKIIITEGALESLEELIDFLLYKQKTSIKKVARYKNEILGHINQLLVHPQLGQYESYLENLQLNHRRIVYNNVKIIYRITGENIFITDIFDTRRDPNKMKG